MRSTDCSVGSKASGAAVEGLMPTQIRGFLPRVPRMYRYSE
ncbi:unknown [Oscillibacter sp. CAG:155]|nr:unknown [Oscillibacter sp. CAG:155]